MNQRDMQMITDLGNQPGMQMIDFFTLLRVLLGIQHSQLAARMKCRQIDNLVRRCLCDHSRS